MGELYKQAQARLREERRLRSMTPEQIEIEQTVDLAIKYLTTSEVWAFPGTGKFHRLSLWHWDGALAWFHGLFGTVYKDSTDGIFWDARPKDLDKPLDVKIIKDLSENGDRMDEGDFKILRARVVQPRDVRGVVERLAPTMVEWSMGFGFFDKQKVETMRMYLGEVGPGRWVSLNGKACSKTDIEDFSAQMTAACGIQFTQHYRWHVYLSVDGRPGISFPTDPVGAQEIFRLRGVPAGAESLTPTNRELTPHVRGRIRVSQLRNLHAARRSRPIPVPKLPLVSGDPAPAGAPRPGAGGRPHPTQGQRPRWRGQKRAAAQAGAPQGPAPPARRRTQPPTEPTPTAPPLRLRLRRGLRAPAQAAAVPEHYPPRPGQATAAEGQTKVRAKAVSGRGGVSGMVDEQGVHVRFDKARTIYEIVQGADECEFGAEGCSREQVEEYLKLAYTALRAMKGERFYLKIEIRNADHSGVDKEAETE